MNFLKDLMSENHNHGGRHNHGMIGDRAYERRVIEQPVVYERVEEVVVPAPHHHHHHEEYYEPERRVEYVEYERGCETDGYAKHGRRFGGY